jgi:glycosyltransferase involved in cell wall biosynthesis
MKIACISTSIVPSSTANSIQVMKVCDAMRQMGQDVDLWVPGEGEVDFEQVHDLYGLKDSFPVHRVREWRLFKRYDFAWKAVDAAIHDGAELIYTWTPQAAVFATWRGKPTILEMHDRATGRFGLSLLKQFLNSTKTNTELVTVTQALKRALETQTGLTIADDRVVIAPNGVDLDRYEHLPDATTARKKLGLKEQVTASYTGHFYAGRGVDVLFELARSFSQVQFLWIGGREQELEGIRRKLSEENLANVTLTGFIANQDLPLYQAASDILLMPYEKSIAGSSGGNSADICSPMKMFEYMAAGRLIITSDLAVIHEVLDDQSAYFCPAEDPTAWKSCLNAILADPNRGAAKARAAREKINQYTIIQRQQNILRKFLRS